MLLKATVGVQHLENCGNRYRRIVDGRTLHLGTRRGYFVIEGTSLAIIPLMNAFSTRHVFLCQMSRIRAASGIHLIFLVIGMYKISLVHVTRIVTGESVVTICFFNCDFFSP